MSEIDAGVNSFTKHFPPYPPVFPAFQFPYGFEMLSLSLLTPILTKPNRFCARAFFTEEDFNAIFHSRAKTINISNAITSFLQEASATTPQAQYAFSDFHPDPMAALLANTALLHRVFGVPYESKIFVISSLSEVIIHVTEHSLDPERLIFILRTPVTDTLPVVLYQHFHSIVAPDLWEKFKRGEAGLNDFSAFDTFTCPRVQRLWSIYEDGWRYVLEIPTSRGPLMVTNRKNCGLGGKQRQLVAFAYEPVHMMTYVSSAGSCGASMTEEIPASPVRISLQEIEQVKELARGFTGVNCIASCAMNCIALMNFCGERQDGLDDALAILSLYPSAELETILLFAKEKVKSDVERLRNQFFGFQMFVAWFTDAIRVANEGKLAQAADLLRSGCAMLVNCSREVSEMVGNVFVRLLELAKDEKEVIVTAVMGVYKDPSGILRMAGVELNDVKPPQCSMPSGGVYKYANVRELLRVLDEALKKFEPGHRDFAHVSLEFRVDLLRLGSCAAKEVLWA